MPDFHGWSDCIQSKDAVCHDVCWCNLFCVANQCRGIGCLGIAIVGLKHVWQWFGETHPWSMSDKNFEQERQIIYEGEMMPRPWKLQLTGHPCEQQDMSHMCSLLGGSSSTVAVWSKEGMQPTRCAACMEQKRGGMEVCIWQRRKWHRRKGEVGQSVSMPMEENREKPYEGIAFSLSL